MTVQDMSDFARLLGEHPEWRGELRRLLLSDELLTLPDLVRESSENVAALIDAHHESEERLTRLEASVAALTEKVAALTEKVAALTEAQQRSEERLTRLEASIAALTEQIAILVVVQKQTEARLDRIEGRLGNIEGRLLEMDYREKASGYFSQLIRKARVVPRSEIDELLEASLSEAELHDLLLTDIFISGRPKARRELQIFIAIEVSQRVDVTDVVRAGRRAELMRRGGMVVIPVAAGETHTDEAELEANRENVALVQDGADLNWAEALAKWLA